MLTHPTIDQLRALRLDGMAEAFVELQSQDAARDLAPAEWLALLLDREAAQYFLVQIDPRGGVPETLGDTRRQIEEKGGSIVGRLPEMTLIARLTGEGREALDTIAAALLKYETLSGDEVGAVLRGDDLEEFRAAQERQRESVAAEAARKEKEAAQKEAAKKEAEQADQPDAGSSDQNPEAGLSGA